MAAVTIIITVLGLVAELYPKVSPMIKDILLAIKGEPVPDITQEEFEARIDAAIAALPEWT